MWTELLQLQDAQQHQAPNNNPAHLPLLVLRVVGSMLQVICLITQESLAHSDQADLADHAAAADAPASSFHPHRRLLLLLLRTAVIVKIVIHDD